MEATIVPPASDLGEDFREAMRRLAASVVMVTTWLDDQPWGLTVSACCSVSMAPPSLLVSLGDHTASAAAIRASGRFGISILGEDQRNVALFGSKAGAPKFVAEYCSPSPGCFAPVVAGAIAHADCTVTKEVEVADHVLLIGEVSCVVLRTGFDRPLLFHSRDFRQLRAAPEEELEGLLYPPW
jgi:flavin reductase ActVB